MLRYAIGIPTGKIVKLLKNTYNIELSKGGAVNILHNARNWFGKDYDQILEKVRASKVKHADETTWRIDGTLAWVWEFLTRDEVYLCIEEGRGGQIPKEKLEGSHKDDVLIRDDYRGYTKLPMNHQSCWSHHLKEARYECEQKGASDEVRQLRVTLQTIFGELKDITAKPFVKGEREKDYENMKPGVDAIVNANYEYSDTKRIQTRIRNQKYNVLTAILYPDVPLTNNLAERILRPMVVTRKMTGGSKSSEGAKTHAVNMSMVQTIQMRNQPLIPTLKEQLYNGTVAFHQARTGKV
jgi:transposase